MEICFTAGDNGITLGVWLAAQHRIPLGFYGMAGFIFLQCIYRTSHILRN